MPIHEYLCTSCKKEFEKLVKMDDLNPPCPSCGKNTDKLFSLFGFNLRGEGFHKRSAIPDFELGDKP